MEVVAGDRIRSLIGVEHLWYPREGFSKCLEIYDFSWGGS